ncbi:hypothetical protein BH09BAC1_BH09BAC1_28330 [soil metagenome]
MPQAGFPKDLPYYLFSIREDGVVQHINEALLNDLGYSIDEMQFKKFDEILTLGSRIFFQTHFFPLIKLHGSFSEIYLTLLSKQKEELPVLLNASILKDNSEHTIWCVGMKITRRVQFEKELREARKTAEEALNKNETLLTIKEELEHSKFILDRQIHLLERKNEDLAEINHIISHDLQEPLRKILMFIDMFSQSTSNAVTEKQRWVLDKIVTSGQRMRNLLLSLQNLSRLMENGVSIAPVDLNILFKKLQALYANRIEQVGAVFIVENMCSIDGDENLLLELFESLLHNSIKYRDPDRKLKIIAKHAIVQENTFKHSKGQTRYETYVKIVFADNGSGMDPQYRNYIFSLFKKLKKDEGMGAGLALAKKIVEYHHGEINAESEIGKGTSIIIYLPIKQI